ncbi:hypothetical protein JHK84_053385 [Glycine max]|nr:hypothetical protein JHK84_053385 [Glycine max]
MLNREPKVRVVLLSPFIMDAFQRSQSLFHLVMHRNVIPPPSYVPKCGPCNCEITVEANRFTCNSDSNGVVISLPRSGKIKVSGITEIKKRNFRLSLFDLINDFFANVLFSSSGCKPWKRF